MVSLFFGPVARYRFKSTLARNSNAQYVQVGCAWHHLTARRVIPVNHAAKPMAQEDTGESCAMRHDAVFQKWGVFISAVDPMRNV